MKKLIALCAALALGGCASGYAQFYTAMDTSEYAITPVMVPGADVQVITSSGNPDSDIVEMWREGFVPIGVADFNGPNEGISGAIAQAKKVGATRIVANSQYSNTVSGTVAISSPTSQTSYTSGTVNAYGSGGYASGNYSGTTTTYGSQTTHVPYSVDRYDQAAVFFAPIPQKGWGILQRPLTTEETQRLGTNHGLYVMSVRTGSPAFKADIVPGDLVRSANGQTIHDGSTWSAVANYGAPLTVTFLRKGEVITKTLHTNADGTW